MKKIRALLILFFVFLASILSNNAWAEVQGGNVSDNDSRCLQYSFKNTETGEIGGTQRICVSHIEDGKFTKDSKAWIENRAGVQFGELELSNDDKTVTVTSCYEASGNALTNVLCNTFGAFKTQHGTPYTITPGVSWDSLDSKLEGIFASVRLDGWEFHNNEQTLAEPPKSGEEVYHDDSVERDKEIADVHEGNLNGGESTDDPSSLDDACYDSGVVSMGWLVCPVISNSANTIDPIEGMIKGMLEVKTGLYGLTDDDGNESATYQAWNIIRNIANIILVIFFLVIIFSQITGYGIDNYGIKKLLPKLIISAIIINLSYIICEVVIDLSNILGQGLCDLFQNIATAISGDKDYTSEFMVGLITALFGVAAGAGALSGTIISIVDASSDTGMMAIVIGLALLVALVAILMFFVMLGARMVIIVGCVAISPVAFACNLLPNTQNLFKKWWKVMEVCLIMYPICGAVYGLSAIIRSIIFSTGTEIHFWEGVVAIIAPFLPFFFLPSLLKSAIGGLGVLGAALTGLATGAKAGAQSGVNAIQNSDRFQRRAQFAKDKTAGLRAQRTIDKLSAKNRARNGNNPNNLDGLSDNEKRRLMDATSQRQAFREKERAINRSTDAYRGALDQNLADKAKEEDIAVFSSQIANDPDLANNMDRRKEELQRELMKTNQDEASTARAAALYRSLAADGKKGFDAIGDVFDSADLKGGSALSQVLGEIKGNMDIKDKAPSLYNVANRLRTTPQQDLSAALARANQVTEERNSGRSTGGLKGSQIPGLTEAEFAAHVNQTSAEAANATYSAISNSDAFSQMTVEQQQQAVDQVANYMSSDDASAEEAYNFINNSNAASYIGNVDKDQLEAIKTKAEGYSTPEQQRHNEQMEAIQNQTWTAHQNAQQQAGPNAQGVYQAPQGFRADLTNPDIYRDNHGNEYNVRTNTFTSHSNS